MSYYQNQEQVFLDQENHAGAHFGDFRANGHNDEPTSFFNAWQSPVQAPPLQSEPSALYLSSLHGSYISPDSERVHSPFADTFQPTHLQMTTFKPERSQSDQSDKDDTFSLESKHESKRPPSFNSRYQITAKSIGIEKCHPVLDAVPSSLKALHRKRPPGKSRKTSLSSSEDDSSIQKAKHAHSVIERRYRDNLNGKIMELHRILLAAETNQTWSVNCTSSVGQNRGSSNSSKVRKSDIMTRAIDYVCQTEIELRDMTDEVKRLQEQVRKFQDLIRWQTHGFPKNTAQFDGQWQ